MSTVIPKKERIDWYSAAEAEKSTPLNETCCMVVLYFKKFGICGSNKEKGRFLK